MISVRRSPAVALVLALAFVLAAAVAPGAISTPAGAVTESCDWNETYHATLDMLGEDPERGWMVYGGDSMDGYGGRTIPQSGFVLVNPEIPCWYVETVVVHEWLHVRQLDRYGTWDATKRAAGSRLDAEMVAECGTGLVIDRPVTPPRSYVEESQRTRGYGCMPWHLLEAASLIADAGHKVSASSRTSP